MTHYYRRAVRLRGKPYPESNCGLEVMYGKDGWCRSCGTEFHEQTGPLTLRERGMKVVDGAWVPYWLPNVICMSAAVGAEAAAEFGLVTREIAWHPASPGDAVQVVLPVSAEPFYTPSELTDATTRKHGSAGKNCTECGRWKWYPLYSPDLPDVQIPLDAEVAILASPERFGDGGISAREIALSARLVDFLHDRSPRDFESRDRQDEVGLLR